MSDWSSDVCASDLQRGLEEMRHARGAARDRAVAREIQLDRGDRAVDIGVLDVALDAVVGRETEGNVPRVAQRVAERHDVELDGEAFGQRRWGRKLVGRERLEREPLARQVRRGDDLPRAVGLPRSEEQTYE